MARPCSSVVLFAGTSLGYDARTMRRFAAAGIPLLCLSLAASLVCPAAPPGEPEHCTTFIGVDADRVLVGNNEDHGNPIVNVWFVPRSEGKHGLFLIGTEGVIQGGMNDRGLVMDGLTIPALDVVGDERPSYPGYWPAHVLETCATVEEVLDSYDAHSFPGIWNGKSFFADATGDAALIEGDAVVRKSGRYLVSTNFLQSATEPDAVTCDRFLTATSMLDGAEVFTEDLFRNILDAVHVEYRDGGGTIYSTIYDPKALTITCYLYHDYRHPVTLDLRDELARGERGIEFPSLFSPYPAYAAWRSEEIETLARTIASFRDDGVDPATYDDLVGDYVGMEDAPFSVPPLALDSFSVVRLGDRLCAVACPERVSCELFPLGNDRFRSTSMNSGTDFDVAFLRDGSGTVSGATFLFVAPDGTRAELPLEKVSSEPTFRPLPGFMAPLPETETGRGAAESAPQFHPAFWLGVGLAAAGLLGLALLLMLP